FAFATTGTGPASWTSGFSLDDDGTAANPLSNTAVFTIPAAQAGAKSITEALTNGWTLTDLTCSGVNGITYSNNNSAGIPRTASFTVASGDAVDCTYTNRKNASISVTKDADPADGTDFDFTGD